MQNNYNYTVKNKPINDEHEWPRFWIYGYPENKLKPKLDFKFNILTMTTWFTSRP